MPSISRRDFLKTSAASFATLSALSAAGAADAPSERVVMAVMGVRQRGAGIIRDMSAMDNVEIAYICDVDQSVVGNGLKQVNARHKRIPKVEPDIRKVLEDKEVTAIAVAAPDHWHALATIWGCQAGKHVFVEKPCSHNIIEGRRMVEAARKHNRIVMVGTQRRSGPHYQSAAEYLQSGKLGKVGVVRTWFTRLRPSNGKPPDGPVPAGVNYDLWLGPAPQRAFNPNRFHYEWHWFWDLGTGELGNNGVHHLDVVRMLLGLDMPTRITSSGQKIYDDDRQTPDTQIACFDFPGTTVTYEHRMWSKTVTEGFKGGGVIFYGDKGTMHISNDGWKVIDGGGESAPKAEFEVAHLQNFIDCVRNDIRHDSKNPKLRINCDIEEGHRSTVMCHLGNIAYRTGRAIRWDQKTEKVVDDADANKLLGRTYRKPFEVPDKV